MRPFRFSALTWLAAVCLVASFPISVSHAQDRQIPEVLEPWKDWVTWDDDWRKVPATFADAESRINFWPSTLRLQADADGASWELDIDVYEEAWIPIPGNESSWPVEVKLNGTAEVVVPREKRPFIRAAVGPSKLSGRFRWNRIPQTIELPAAIGIVDLQVDGNPVTNPKWDENGNLWLKRVQRDQQDSDQMNVLVYRVIEDGIPMWLRTQIELTVSGKSREEQLGSVLPSGWQLSRVESPVPVAVDESGVMKAQVRPGKWTVSVDAFRTSAPDEIGYAEDATPIVNQELIGWKAAPNQRIVQIEGLESVDAAQTEFPTQWRGLPLYLWKTDTPFQLAEKMRGMGSKIPEGLSLKRQLWLDEDGSSFTYEDRFTGNAQQIWRLDAAPDNELGAVRIDGEAQLITANPESAAPGVEIRTRNLKLSAVGRLQRGEDLAATGWQTDAERLKVTMTLPPGWRAVAVLGVDSVRGDWLTAWSLLDLFLLLIFSLAICRLFGFPAGILAFIGFGLAYHEMGSPRFTWLLPLIPIALLRVVHQPKGRAWLQAFKYASVGFFLYCFVPFIAMQTQTALYPQLEPSGYAYGSRDMITAPNMTTSRDRFAEVGASIADTAEDEAPIERAQSVTIQSRGKIATKSMFEASNLLQDPSSRIQTGPAKPQWYWNDVRCVWNGPVTSDQRFRPILISTEQNRIVTTVRILLLLLLAIILLRDKRGRLKNEDVAKQQLASKKQGKTAAAASVALTTALLLLCPALSAQETIPDTEMLKVLRTRLLDTPEAASTAADFPEVKLTVDGTQLTMVVDVHAAAEVAVPLPGRFPTWSPLSVKIDDQDDAIVCRKDGYLWAIAPAGIHQFTVKGVLPAEADWEWTFQLKPRFVSVDADGWKVSGINPDGIPDDQVFFVREVEVATDVAAYDRTVFNPVVVIDRYIEVGLDSKVRNVVSRLSASGKAVALQIPLLPGESVLSGNIDVEGGEIAVRMGAAQNQFEWESELPAGNDIVLTAVASDRAVERWHLVTSPIWNVSLDGLSPVFENGTSDLIPIWRPWPGESATIAFSKPLAITGANMTIQNVRQSTALGNRQRSHELALDVECSLASDLIITIAPDAEITSLQRDGQTIPVQKRDGNLIVPARPKRQSIELKWRTAELLETRTIGTPVTLPVDASNVTRTMTVPQNRWVLWTEGPLRGPAVQFWSILIVALIAALILGSLPHSPIGRIQWILLMIGLTQVPLVGSMIVIGWLFLLAWRGREDATVNSPWVLNLAQIIIVMMTVISIVILLVAVGEGLLGNPKMFIAGNDSYPSYLNWFQPRVGTELPAIKVISVSVWFYRILMLLWALWLASALLRWLVWGWQQFSHGFLWARKAAPVTYAAPAASPQPANAVISEPAPLPDAKSDGESDQDSDESSGD